MSAASACAPTTSSRLIWYGIETCRYWTDDFSKLALRGEYRIPCCPVCGRPGMQIVEEKWAASVKQHDALNPGYAAKLASEKEKCARQPVKRG
jgi:hypothetical protein